MHMGRPVRGLRSEAGITLAELVVAMAVVAIITVALLSLWEYAQSAYFVGSERAEVQEDARVALDQMVRDLTKAGRDVIQCAFDSEAYTQCSGAKLTRCQAMLGVGFTCNNQWIIPIATSSSIQVQMDLNADGLIDTSAPSEESVTYAFDGGSKTITRQQGTGTARTLADNIQNLILTYEGPTPNNGVCTGVWSTITPGTQTDRDCIQRVIIDLVAQSTVGAFGGSGSQTVSRTVRTTVDLRTR
jgi:type II secretory pathway component PulJ